MVVVQPQINHSAKQMFATLVMDGIVNLLLFLLFFHFALCFCSCLCLNNYYCCLWKRFFFAGGSCAVCHLKFQHICFDCCSSWWVVADDVAAVGGGVAVIVLLCNVAFQWSMVFANFMVKLQQQQPLCTPKCTQKKSMSLKLFNKKRWKASLEPQTKKKH